MRAIPRLPALSAALDAAGLQFVDVGARGDAFPPFRRVAPWVHYCAFEPDAQEAARLEDRIRRSGGWREVTVVPNALASSDGEVELYLTEHPGFSSTLQPDRAVGDRWCRSEGFAPRGSVRVPALALDTAASKYGFTRACFLKVDTQGSELAILGSGASLLERSVLGLYVEILLQPFYEDQPKPGATIDFLVDRGFALVDLQRTFLRRAGHDEGLFSRRQIVWAHALFMRDPSAVADGASFEVLARYVGIAIAFDQFDLALELVRRAGSRGSLENDLIERLKRDIVAIAEERTRDVLQHLPRAAQPADVLSCALKDRRDGPQ